MKSKSKNKEKSDSDESSSDGGHSVQGMKKKMTKKQRDKSQRRVGAVLAKTGSTFPSEEESTNSSGTDNDLVQSKKQKRKVKSGAKVRSRPVIKTELWPHTIANEEDAIDATSDNISLAKFLSCFTYIMIHCEDPEEATGRGLLLHAVSLVLECLPWSEARAFHNWIMVKVEQGRIDWDSDFTLLANEFVDKKMRQLLRSKNQASSSSSNARNGFRGFNRGYRNSYGKSNNSNTYYNVCKQWNEGTCTYGDKCRKQHVYWTCYEARKTGELHNSSSHGAPARGKQN